MCHIHLISSSDITGNGSCGKVNEEDKPATNPEKLCKLDEGKVENCLPFNILSDGDGYAGRLCCVLSWVLGVVNVVVVRRSTL